MIIANNLRLAELAQSNCNQSIVGVFKYGKTISFYYHRNLHRRENHTTIDQA